MSTRPQRTAAVSIAIALTAVGTVGAAGVADAKGYQEDTLNYGFFYGDFEAGHIATAGIPAEGFCGPDGGQADLRVFLRNDGTATLKSHGQRDVPIYLYEFDGDAPELIGLACDALFDNDPATEPPAPFAVGSALLKSTTDGIEGPDDIGGFDVSNSINGHATSPDGSQWKVIGRADLSIDEAGEPIGDPADFQRLTVRQVGHNQ